jgi:transmembrane sensor
MEFDDSGPHRSQTALSTRSAAAEWLVARQMAEDWTAEQQAALNDWLARSAANRIAYWRFDAAWGQAQRLSILRRPMRPPPRSQKKSIGFWLPRIVAAMVMVGALGTFAVQYATRSDFQTYRTPVGGRMTIGLEDGSKIELNTATVLRVSNHSGQRQAVLEHGEAYFQIVHDPAHPFVLTAGAQRITDLGTAFSVRKQNGDVSVTLFEGRARLETIDKQGETKPTVLKPGDIAIATPKSVKTTKEPLTRLRDGLAWRRGMIEFKRATLAEAARQFNRYNHTKIIIEDPQVAALTIHGTFPENDVWAFADAAKAYFNLHAERHGDTIVITR